jgi:hypothetical protein
MIRSCGSHIFMAFIIEPIEPHSFDVGVTREKAGVEAVQRREKWCATTEDPVKSMENIA